MTFFWIWVIIAVVAGIVELLGTDLFLAAVAVGAVITAVSALALPLVLQLPIFAVVALLGISVVRPPVKRALGIHEPQELRGPIHQTQIEGRRGIVTQRVTGGGGQIRIGQGDFWSARSFDPDQEIEVGTPVDVLLVDGITALVAPKEAPALQTDPRVVG